MGYLLFGWVYDGLTLRMKVERHNAKIDKAIAMDREGVEATKANPGP